MVLQSVVKAAKTARGALCKGVAIAAFRGTLKGTQTQVTLDYAGPGDLSREVEWFFNSPPRKVALLASPDLAFIAAPIPVPGDDVDLFYPYLDATLPVASTVDAQIARVRSKPHRRRLRSVQRSPHWVYQVVRTQEAFDHFLDTLHLPFVNERFVERARLPDRAMLRRRFKKSGLVVQVLCDGVVVSGALLFHEGSKLDYDRNGFGAGLSKSATQLAEKTAAVELAIFHVAQELGVSDIAMGFCRAFLRCGLYTHKRRLGCTFQPATGLPPFRLKLPRALRPAFLSAVPMLVGKPAASTARVGLVENSGRREKPDWKSLVRNLTVPSVRHIEVWTNASAARVELFVGYLDTFAPGRTVSVYSV